MNDKEKKKQNHEAVTTHQINQHIHAPINGHVAGRDVIIKTLESKPESQLQAEFAERTGIWCPKSAREWLESLLAEHGFTVRELRLAWGNSSIGWHATKNEERITTHWFEAFFAWTMAGVLTLYVLVYALNALTADWSAADLRWKMSLGALVLIVVYMGTCWMLSRFILLPRRVAIRVRATQAIGENALGGRSI